MIPSGTSHSKSVSQQRKILPHKLFKLIKIIFILQIIKRTSEAYTIMQERHSLRACVMDDKINYNMYIQGYPTWVADCIQCRGLLQQPE